MTTKEQPSMHAIADFCHAAEDGRLNDVALFLDLYGDGAVNSILEADGNKSTALMWAAYANRPGMVRFLLGKGADMHIVSEGGTTARDVAELQQNFDVVFALGLWEDAQKERLKKAQRDAEEKAAADEIAAEKAIEQATGTRQQQLKKLAPKIQLGPKS